MSTKINYIFVHHTGSIGINPNSSSKNLTLQQIDNAHRERWPDFKSSLGYFVGYSVVIFPDGSMVQTRKIGEELAANKGYNTVSFAPCLAGNFTSGVDYPTPAQISKLLDVMRAVYDKNPESIGLQVVPGTEIDVPIQNVFPHRRVATTECYGFSLSDSWAQNILATSVKISFLQRLLVLYQSLLALLKTKKVGTKVATEYTPCWLKDNR